MMQNILIVDDKNENLIALETILEQPDVSLLKAADGNEALRLLLKHDVALALLDVKMPGMDGFEMAEIMRRSKKTQLIPIIFVTANGDKRHVFRGYEVGAVDYLSKPIDREVLLSKVRIFLELDRQRRELESKLEEIRHLKEQNEQLLHALGDGVIAVDAGGNISFANPAMKHLFGIDPVALAGRNITEVLFNNEHGMKTPWLSSEMFIATSSGDRFQRESGFCVRGNTPDDVQEIYLSAAPVQGGEGSYGGAVITLRLPVERNKSDLMEDLAKKGRRQARKKVSTVLRLFDRTTGTNLGRLANISLDGFKLISRDHISAGARYPISMVLPETIAASNTLSFDCQAVWCRPAEDKPHENYIGFRIIKISDNDLRVLVQLIERY
jgi:CheY-like chemotaxis protein